MKNLSQYIADNRALIDEYFDVLDNINYEIIREGLQCKLIQDVVKQYDQLADKWHDDKVLNNYYARTNRPYPIRSLFTRYQYTWDKITDDMVQTFDPHSKEGNKLYSRLCSNRSNSIQGICIFETEESDYNGIKTKYSGMIVHIYDAIMYQSLLNESYRQKFRPTEAFELLARCNKIHIIELTEQLSTSKIRGERSSAQNGMINPGDKAQYAQIAAKNMERYKKLAAKLKIEREMHDDIPDKVMEAVKKVMDLSVDASKNPMKYIGIEYHVQKLIELVGDKQTSSTYRGRTSTYGVNGLMYYFSSYIKSKIEVSSGNSYGFERDTYKNSKASLLKLIKMIDEKLAEIDKKLKEKEAKSTAAS